MKTQLVRSASRRAVMVLLKAITGGELRLSDGDSVADYGTMEHDLVGNVPIAAEITVKNSGAYGELLRHGGTGLGTSYAKGFWDSPDLTATLRLLARSMSKNRDRVGKVSALVAPLSNAIYKHRGENRAQDRRNIGAHYDLGNELFERILDETMMYSSAVFEPAGISLADASREKLRRLCELLDLKEGDHVLEIGTGWGGFALYAAGEFNCRVTTTTISQEQFDLATKRVAEAGLGHLIEVRSEHYLDLIGSYDKIISIEMIEAVQWYDYEKFFANCKRLLKPGGAMAMQAITISEKRFEYTKTHDDFIRKMIFPGGCLPSVGALSIAASKAGNFEITQLSEIGLHYAETLRRWRKNLENNSVELRDLGYDEYFQRLWKFYLCYCEAGFEERYISDVQMLFTQA